MSPFAVALLALAIGSQLLSVSCADTSTTLPITLAGGACSGLTLNALPNKYSYQATVASVNLNGCSSSDLRFSKVYVQDACAKVRDNIVSTNFYKTVTCDHVSDSSTATCQKVFSEGGSDNLVNDNSTSIGTVYDSSNVCADSNTAYIFLQNSCANPIDVSVKVTTGGYSGQPCLTVAGHTLSGVAIAVIVVAAVIAVFAVVFLISCCCCGRWCC